jgi:hypothetical protein
MGTLDTVPSKKIETFQNSGDALHVHSCHPIHSEHSEPHSLNAPNGTRVSGIVYLRRQRARITPRKINRIASNPAAAK